MEAVVSRPCLWTLPSTFKTLYICDFNYDDESTRQAVFQLISDAAVRADNVGVDEFTAEWFDSLLHYVDVAVSLNNTCDEQTHYYHQQQQRLVGLIVITESRFSRTPHPRACQLFVFTSPELSGRLVRRDLTRLGVALAAQSSQHYIDCFFEVFVPCLEHVLTMRDEGFIITACIPTAGLLAGHTEHVDSYVMYKQLGALDTHSVSKLYMS